MLYALLLAHLLGDYVFQTDAVAEWKENSVTGTFLHGGIVTVCTLVCTTWLDASWWPYALGIGAIHIVLDLLRAALNFQGVPPSLDLVSFLLDQTIHLVILGGALWLAEGTAFQKWVGLGPSYPRHRWLAVAVGYCFLTAPAWVGVRFWVRGLWGADAAPPLPEGERYIPMMERVWIATCVLFEGPALMLIPLALAPRLLVNQWRKSCAPDTIFRGHWARFVLSALVAVGVGLILRMVI